MKKSVLLIERDQDLQEFLCKLFQFDGWWVATACDKLNVLQVLKTSAIELVVTDMNSLGEEGMDLVRSIREQSDASILVLSAQRDKSNINAVMEQGVNAYLTIPFDPSQLRARSYTLVRQRYQVGRSSVRSGRDANSNVGTWTSPILKNLALRIRALMSEGRP